VFHLQTSLDAKVTRPFFMLRSPFLCDQLMPPCALGWTREPEVSATSGAHLHCSSPHLQKSDRAF
jgi:hypothetical protein